MPKLWVTAVLLLLVVSSLGLIAAVAPGSTAATGSARSPSTQSAADPVTHGDLLVQAGQTFVIQPTLAGPTYYQGGNITVEAGGTLDVENVTLSFVQYVATTGTAEQRLSHIFTFTDAGTVNFYGANLTTDVQVINAYAKLNLSVSGTLHAWSSSFAFPGWIYVNGPSADMMLNQSNVTWNSNVQSLEEPLAILGDTLWAPTITVTGGANFTLLDSQIQHVYADDTQTYGFPRPTALTFENALGAPTGPGTTTFVVSGPSDSANLTLDYLYPSAGALNGYVTFTYVGALENATVDLAILFGGVSYPIATDVLILANYSQTLTYPFPTALVNAITAGGMLEYLNDTGDFGVAAVAAITVDTLTGPSFDVTGAFFQMNTSGFTYNDEVVGSELSAVDAQLGFTWSLYNAATGAQYSQQPPFPWLSNKLLFVDHSVAYLANITTPSESLPGVFSASALLPDATSQVYLYRWAQFNLTGRGGVLPIQGATISAYYAYNSSQANNATTTALNQIQTAVPSVWGYLQYWDAQHGILKYGTTNAAGQGFLLLASGNITANTLPDGLFLGAYHIGVFVPAVGVGSHWFNWSVSPYPTGVAAATPHFNGPDIAPQQGFPDYFGDVSVSSLGVTANGAVSSVVELGQTLGVKLVLNDSGTATITQVLVQLYYNTSFTSSSLLAENESTTLHLTAPGQQVTFTLAWLTTDTVTGLHGWWYAHNLTVALEYNYNIPSLAGGAYNTTVPLLINPSQITITSFSLPPSTTLDLTQSYISTGTVVYNGSEPASITLWATPVGGGTPTELGETPHLSGNFQLTWFDLQSVYPALVPGTSYTITARASYNDREMNFTLAGTYTVPKPPTSPTSLLLQKFLGLPLWVWIVIAAAAAAGIVGFLFLARRQAAGKLVECGECGNLIPEDATVCPKCGAEFESDLIRCSRCASTIPADSKYCPECAAQLLGKPGEGETDPERQAYADFTEKYRAEAKRELGDNYTEGAFWDWWKRQPTYTPFSQWSLQQGQGTARAGMTAPPAGAQGASGAPPPMPPKGGAPPGAGWTEAGAAAGAAAPAAKAPPAPSTTTTVPPPAPGGAGLKACPSCGKEIPAEYLVCPFCNAVTQ